MKYKIESTGHCQLSIWPNLSILYPQLATIGTKDQDREANRRRKEKRRNYFGRVKFSLNRRTRFAR